MPSTCGNFVQTQWLSSWKTVGKSSTDCGIATNQPVSMSAKSEIFHTFVNKHPLLLSTPKMTILPLLNTFFTQFPQHLLIERLYKKLRKV